MSAKEMFLSFSQEIDLGQFSPDTTVVYQVSSPKELATFVQRLKEEARHIPVDETYLVYASFQGMRIPFRIKNGRVFSFDIENQSLQKISELATQKLQLSLGQFIQVVSEAADEGYNSGITQGYRNSKPERPTSEAPFLERAEYINSEHKRPTSEDSFLVRAEYIFNEFQRLFTSKIPRE